MYLSREIKCNEVNVHFVYPISLSIHRTELDLASTLAFTSLLLPTHSTHEHQGSQIHYGAAFLSHMAQAHLGLASKLPSSAEAFQDFLCHKQSRLINSIPHLHFLFCCLGVVRGKALPCYTLHKLTTQSVIAVRGLQSA